jgi:hypothetical protein
MMMKRVFLFQALRCQDLSDAKLVFHVIRAPPTHFPFVRAARLAAPPWAEPVLRGGQWSKAVRLAFELKQPRKLFGVLTEMLDTGFKVPTRTPCCPATGVLWARVCDRACRGGVGLRTVTIRAGNYPRPPC